MIRAVFCAVLVLALTGSVHAQQASSALTMKVDADSSISLKLGDQLVANGKIALRDDQNLFDHDANQHLVLGVSEIKNLQSGADWAKFTQVFPGVDVDYDVRLTGEDLKVVARITNHSDKPFDWFSFTFPTIQFSRDATGTIPSWHSSYLQARGPSILHPSYMIPFGGVYACDDHFGIGCSTESHLTKQSMFYAVWQRDGIIPAKCALEFLGDASIEPLASKTIDFTVRISVTTDWKHLLENYRATYLKQTGGQQYVADQRPWAFFAAVDPLLVQPNNPFGFNGAVRRFDLPRGAAAFVSEFGFPAQKLFQGMILWAAGGVSPRGAMYRPDFDCFPDAVQQNLPIVTQGFAKFGERIGLATRPSQMIWPVSYTSDSEVTLDGRNQDQLDALWARFDHVIKQGFNAFYLDSFGANYNDYLVVKFLRAKFGRDIPTFTEMTNDLTAAYSGAYVEMMDKDGNTRWFNHSTLEMLRWLNPDMCIMCKDMSRSGYGAIYAHHMSPLVEDGGILSSVAQIKFLNAQYLDGSRWK